MSTTFDSNRVFQPIRQLLRVQPQQSLTMQRPFSNPPVQNAPLLLAPNQLFQAQPSQTPAFQSDQLSLNFGKRARASAVSVLQKEASASSINRAIDVATGTHNTYNNRVEMLVDGKEAFDKIKETLRSAKQSIYFETFIYHDDQTGWEIAKLLAEKKKEGVDVKVLYDAVGCLPDKKEALDYMRHQGIDVLAYNRQLFSWEKINVTHRKLVLVDGYKGITGGMNIGDEYAHEWHDLMAAFEGEAVVDMQNEFFYNWQKAGGKMPAFIPKLPPGQVFGNSAARVTVTSPDELGKEKDTKNAMISAINSALHHIYVEQPYFSDEDFVENLLKAANRGVKVKVFLPEVSDNQFHDVLNKRNAKRLVEAGGEVFFIEAGPNDRRFTHGKIMTIDGVWTTIGSTNTDTRALAVNQELNVSVTDANFAYTVEKRVFERDQRSSIPFTNSRFPWLSQLKAQFFSFFHSLF